LGTIEVISRNFEMSDFIQPKRNQMQEEQQQRRKGAKAQRDEKK